MRRVAMCCVLIALALGGTHCRRPPEGLPGAPPEPPPDNAVVAPATPADNVLVPPVVAATSDNVTLPDSPGRSSATPWQGPAAAGAAATADIPAYELPAARPLRPVKRIVVDPGHGGENVGAVVGGVAEREVNLDVGLRLAEALRAKGFEVTLTRIDDASVSLEDRAEVANLAGADLFISLHSNAAANQDAGGIEIYFPTEIFRQNGRFIDDDARARDIATRDLPDGPFTWDGDFSGDVTPERLALHRDLAQALGFEIERAMTATLGTTSRGVKPAGFEVLRWASCPAVLVEMGFLTNDEDREKLADRNYRARIARAITDAVCAYGNLSLARKAGMTNPE